MSLTSADARPSAGFFLGLQDVEDPDEANLEAAKAASNAMMAREAARRGY